MVIPLPFYRSFYCFFQTVMAPHMKKTLLLLIMESQTFLHALWDVEGSSSCEEPLPYVKRLREETVLCKTAYHQMAIGRPSYFNGLWIRSPFNSQDGVISDSPPQDSIKVFYHITATPCGSHSDALFSVTKFTSFLLVLNCRISGRLGQTLVEIHKTLKRSPYARTDKSASKFDTHSSALVCVCVCVICNDFFLLQY